MGVFRESKGVVSRQGQAQRPEGTYEDQYSRHGFAGDQAMLYRRHPATAWTRIEGPFRNTVADTNVMDLPDRTDPRALPTVLMFNEDVAVAVSHRSEPMPFHYRNADGDELIFVQRGRGVLRTDFGPLRFGEGDYLVVPKAVTYRMVPETTDNLFYVVRTTGPIGFPERGVLGQYVPFDFGVLETPEPDPARGDESGEWEVVVEQTGRLSSIFYPFDPMDVVGWQGTVAPFRLNIRDIRSISAERLDIPPSGYATFDAPGCWICTFTPRPMQSDPDSSFVPPYHRNVDYDEVSFILGSEDEGATAHRSGLLYVNPQGAHHGPDANPFSQPERPARFTTYLLNVDVVRPLTLTAAYEAYATDQQRR
ncbi:homogentisate 1,2-dioxygenase [Nocardia aurantia]|uniref:Homogentisate 1,2-dioxygenase n=1 Tax=Nocardia aurantia TaxID=2585199 RepID=A0A7K0DUL9_9NOCA|nr:homogentisate 1,2-dioxygenase [Nocardia aurantia]MQY29449.1 Homogentisate 1,2-dioxygenase [Nocardia aurantia]